MRALSVFSWPGSAEMLEWQKADERGSAEKDIRWWARSQTTCPQPSAKLAVYRIPCHRTFSHLFRFCRTSEHVSGGHAIQNAFFFELNLIFECPLVVKLWFSFLSSRQVEGRSVSTLTFPWVDIKLSVKMFRLGSIVPQHGTLGGMK